MAHLPAYAIKREVLESKQAVTQSMEYVYEFLSTLIK